MDNIIPFDFLIPDPTDVLEYFRVALRREYPDLGFERMGNDIVGWVITLPSQRTYAHTNVEAHCIHLQEELFWKKDTLVQFVVARDSEELDALD